MGRNDDLAVSTTGRSLRRTLKMADCGGLMIGGEHGAEHAAIADGKGAPGHLLMPSLPSCVLLHAKLAIFFQCRQSSFDRRYARWVNHPSPWKRAHGNADVKVADDRCPLPSTLALSTGIFFSAHALPP